MRDQVLIVGLGEVGRALFEIFKESGKFEVYGFDIDQERMRKIVGESQKLPEKVDIMHICYPCIGQKKFVKTTVGYIEKFKPKITIINSTVPPGTTQKVYNASKGSPVVHSPIRGMHKNLETMKNDIKFWTKYIGGITTEWTEVTRKHFEKLGLKVKILRSPIETELAKLFETIYRAWMIACFQEMHRISRHFGASFDEVVDMIEDIHRARLNKPLHYPGVIGGHCLIPNCELLLSKYDSELLRLVLKSNNKRKKEIENEEVREEVEKIKRRVEKLESYLKELLSKVQ
jgi:UDP-N-acetyl-D-mannosaminuronate dehydrogenase